MTPGVDRLPRGPRVPRVLQSIGWAMWPVPFIDACGRRYGSPFTLRMAGVPPIVVLTDPASVRDVISGDPSVFHAGAANAYLKPTTWLRAFGKNSLLLLDDEAHASEKRHVNAAFYADGMRTYERFLGQCVDRAIDRWPMDGPFELHSELLRLSLDAVVRATLGLVDPESRAVRSALMKLFSNGEHPGLVFFGSRLNELRGRAYFEELVRAPRWARSERFVDQVEAELRSEVLRRRRTGAEPGDDVLSGLLRARTPSGDAGDEWIVDELKTLLIAGHEATANALTWAIYEVLRHPDVLARLERGSDDGDEYADAVARETLRLHPTVPMLARRLTRAATVGGRSYPAGTVLVPSIYAAQRDPASWPEPERFEPNRFMASKGAAADWFPFGGGARRCVGMAFALLEMRIALRRIVERGRLRFAPGYRPRGVRRGISFVVAEGLPVVRDRPR
jgi:cytochrome P450